MIEQPYWWETVGQGDRPHEPPRRADVVVVGAGYTGLAAARHLARTGAAVVVLERERVGWGASSRNGGQVLPGLSVDAETLVRTNGEVGARELFELSKEAIAQLEQLIAGEGIDCAYQRTGHVQAAARPQHFEAFRHEQALLARTFSHRVELVPRSRQRSEIGTDAYHGLLVDECGAALNPARYVEGLAAAAERAGAQIIERCEVSELLRNGARWTVATPHGNVDAADALVATNGYTGPATPWLRSRVVPIGSYAIATEPLSGAQAADLLPHGRTAFDSKHLLHYFRLTATRRLVFGGRAAFASPAPETTRRAASVLHRDLLRVFPQLADVRVTHAWGGAVAFTRDRLPHAGQRDAYYSLGYCGHGIALATCLGTAVARRLSGEPVTNPLMDRRFPSIPLYRGRPWFLPLVGAYFRLKDLLG
ncbi:MAG: NAD(P)/FAD-dependent oxidoreductase [Betaproteobacteria bacterium]